MSDKQKILLSIVILLLFSLQVFIMFSDSGLADLFKLKSEKDRLLQENARLKRDNLTMYRMIERLKNDPEYIESIARKELGMIQKGEVILKPTPSGDKNKP
jgi:cell division protein FtsB